MSKLKVLIFKKLLTIGIISLLIASNYSNAGGWSGIATVDEIYALNPTQVIVKLSTFSNPHACLVNADGQVIFNPSTNKEFLSIFLAAQASGRKVNVFVGDTCTPVWNNTSYADIIHVKIGS
ncbi:hypothetical protein CBP51_07085 [Cellvibrio mixtus]|uniref:Uncharacterized protein n=1 Tax=Cellvibrio mixtus TaxID=39650 RepID=A0A266QA80_9GAMM|nr:hypothetical protein [Cellvibrio mixtus]OZY86768.1 hypothetical protein CBP51_07085 [Cellvibrio mixtus]